ncbi:MAG: hypothetical protein NWF00_04910 [Candidatus Bathyarchaeota archaeon]|nr:hypothetical protein [Candidatus Bathyarchaeota archaeon]
MEVSIKVSGIAEVQAAFARLDLAMLRQVHDKLTLWAESIRDSATQKVPVRTGYLRSTIFAQVSEWIAEIGAEATYAACVEFGTRYMRAQPYILPALQEHLPMLEEILIEAIEAAKMEAGL